MPSANSVLIVSESLGRADQLATMSLRLGLRPICCNTVRTAQLMTGLRHRMVFCDEKLQDGDFRGIIQQNSHNLHTPVIVISEKDDWNSYLNALKAGAFDYVMFPAGAGEIERVVRTALRETEYRLDAA
jgi:DNA-binding NtrC family response regulator